MRLLKEIKCTPEAQRLINSLPTVYLVGCWARYGVMPFPFSRKYDKKTNEPLVYDYDDMNGACDSYFLRPISHTTTGWIICWTFEKSKADLIANALNVYNPY